MLSRFLQGGGELLVPTTSHHQPASLRLQALELFASMVDKASVPGLNKDNVDKLNFPLSIDQRSVRVLAINLVSVPLCTKIVIYEFQ